MYLNSLAFIALLLTGCQSTKVVKTNECQFEVNFSLSEKLTSQAYLNYQQIDDYVAGKYKQKYEKTLDIQLVKAYVSRGHLILQATAVISEASEDSTKKVYYRASDVDDNVFNAKSEYQSVLHKAVSRSIDKAILEKHQQCLSEIS